VPGDIMLWPGLTGGQCIDVLTHAQGSGSAPHRGELIERLDLDPTKRAREYSKGNRQKVALVAALSVDVDLLILDEPTSGLDPLMEQVSTTAIQWRFRRRSVVIWVLCLAGALGATAFSIARLYDTDAEIQDYADSVSGGALYALNGRFEGINTLGG
jgi:ABC-2 type transport system ATP-binding protein